MARIQKGQSYEDLGFRVDDKGIAYDLATGAGLPKSVVDQRLAGSGMSQLGKKRGGIAGLYDRNKSAIPAAQTALAMLPGIGPLISAGIGGLRGFDREGQGGIGYDVGTGLKGAATGYAAGMAGNALQGALGKGMAAGSAAKAGGGSALSQLGAGAKAAIPSLLGGGQDGGGFKLPSLGTIGSGIKDAVTGNGGMNALAFAQLLNSAQLGKKSGDLADEALNTQRDLFANKAPLRSAGIAGMQAPRTELPQLAKLGAVGNPFAGGR
jgi:hypothetical protein